MVGLFSRVDAQVALQCLQVAESGPADLTWVWFLSGVDQHVSAKVSDLKKTKTK